ncbi:MAG: carbohydrate ABC transporter permease [Ruminiclostridium sp.]|nr:carbohydrate ABC transporter permease [Ruminiclostridium sp.]
MVGKRSVNDLFFDISDLLLMIFTFIIMAYPFIYILSYSLSDPLKITTGLVLYPEGFSLDAYKAALGSPSIFHAIFISILRTTIGPIFMILVTAMAGYCITREDMKGVRIFRKYFVYTMYISAGLIPTFLVIKALGLVGSFWIYILPSSVSVFNMVLIKSFIESIPKSLEESAMMDGANDFYLFWRIIFPICTPVIAAVTLFGAVGQWNAFMDTQIYNTMHPELFTLQYVLYLALTTPPMDIGEEMRIFITPKAFRMAMTVLTILPILAIYPVLQKYFVGGIMIGAVKG